MIIRWITDFACLFIFIYYFLCSYKTIFTLLVTLSFFVYTLHTTPPAHITDYPSFIILISSLIFYVLPLIITYVFFLFKKICSYHPPFSSLLVHYSHSFFFLSLVSLLNGHFFPHILHLHIEFMLPQRNHSSLLRSSSSSSLDNVILVNLIR